MKNILITGGAGFIGSNFIRHTLSTNEGAKVINLDALTYAGNLSNLTDIEKFDNYTFIEGDITDRDLVTATLKKHSVDTIIHFAAETHVDRSIEHPGDFLKTNIDGTYTLLDCAYHYWQSEKLLDGDQVRFHHISTDEVYGSLDNDSPSFSETSQYMPNSPYAASKAASDHLVRAYNKTYGLPTTITNCSNNYGPYQYPEKLIPFFILNAIEGKPLPIYGDGMQKRDWLFVEDHCEAISLVVKNGRSGEMYNVGAGKDVTNLFVVQTLCEILDEWLPQSKHVPHFSLLTHVDDRPGHDRRYALDITKITTELGWVPKRSFEDGMLGTVQWYLNNMNWIEDIRNRPDYLKWVSKNYDNRTIKRGKTQ